MSSKLHSCSSVLQIYSSILYLRIPQCFRIILRGQIVEHHNIANDLKFWEVILYKPHMGGNVEVCISFYISSPR